MKEKERVAYLDCLRCFAIFLVIVLHVLVPVVSNTGLYGAPSWELCVVLDAFTRVGVPLFFMLSGWLMLSRDSTREIGAFYRKNLPKLLLPLLVWNGIYYLWNAGGEGGGLSLEEFLAGLLNQGHGYHMWFIYTLLGVYLLCPYIKRIADGCSGRQLLLLVVIILIPTTLQPILNLTQPVYLNLFPPMLEGYLGYFLVGYYLGGHPLGPWARYALYLLGLAAFLIAAVGNLAAASPKEILLPFNGGYRLNHYLTAAAVFVLVRTLFEAHRERLAPMTAPLASLSSRVSGVYWVHALALAAVTRAVGADLTVLEFVGVRLAAACGLSLLFAALASRLPGPVRRALM